MPECEGWKQGVFESSYFLSLPDFCFSLLMRKLCCRFVFGFALTFCCIELALALLLGSLQIAVLVLLEWTARQQMLFLQDD